MTVCTHPHYEAIGHQVRYEFKCDKCGERATKIGDSSDPPRSGCTDSGNGPYDLDAHKHRWLKTKHPEVKRRCTECGYTRDWDPE